MLHVTKSIRQYPHLKSQGLKVMGWRAQGKICAQADQNKAPYSHEFL